MNHFSIVEEIIFKEGVPSVCIKSEQDTVDVEPEEKAGDIYELMIPKQPTKSVITVLKKYKNELDKTFGTEKYFIKLRSFNFYFSYLFFNDYKYKNDLKSFLSVSTTETINNNGVLEITLKIVVIGKPQSVLIEEIHGYFTEKLKSFNHEIKYVKIVLSRVSFKDTAFVSIGEPEPEFEDLDLDIKSKKT